MSRLSRVGLLASCFAAASLIALTSLFAQNLSPQKQREKTVFPFVVDEESRIDVNNIDMYVTNHGTFARDLIGGGPGGLFFPKGSVKTAIYTAGLSIGAMVNGELRVAIAEYNDEFGPGIMLGGTPDDPEDPRFRVYKITTGDGPGDPDWDAWPIADGAPDDGAGNPLLIGNQTLWTVFNDADTSLHTAGRGSTLPLGVEVQLTVIAYRWPNALANTIFLKYRIINKSANLLEDAYLYFWNDPDMGGYTDDLIGFDPTLDLGYVYNSSNLDGVYQVAPPAVGYIMLQGPQANGGGRLGATAFHAQDNTNDPANAAEVYNIMQGLNNDGSQIIDPITGLPTTYMYSGDPVAGTGWLDESPADKRCALNAGPFTMAAGDTQEVVFAILVGQGENRLNSIEVLRAMVPVLENTYNSGFPAPSPPNSDAAAVMIEQPPNGSNFQSLDPSATVAHLGWGTATFNAYYSISLGGTPEYQSTRNASSVAAGQTMHLEFDPWLPSTPGIYDVMLLASSAGDADAENDTLRAQIEIISPLAPVDLQLISRSAGEAVLAWQPPPAGGDIAGYNICRSAVSGGPYIKLNGALLTDLTFTDTAVPSEVVYYVVTLELVGGLESENSDELPVYPVMTVADSGLLLVNGVHWATYGPQIEDFYNAQMAGTLSFDFWDLFSGNPVGFDPLGEDSAPPPELFQQYKSVIWIGNNYAGDIDYWYESLAALKQYMLSGGNLLLATRRAATFFDNVLSTSYANINSWSGYVTIGGSNPLVAIVPGLVDMPPGNGASESSLANMFLASSPPSPAIISTFTPIFDWDDLDVTIWKGGFRSELTGGGQLVFISGRPYRFDQAASQANYNYILVNWFGHYAGPVWHVSTTGDNSNDGSPNHPFRDIQYAFDIAAAGDSILVAEGIYDENPFIDGKTLALFGGFEETGWTRDLSLYETTIDGGGRNSTVRMHGGNSVLDGFSVTNGQAPDHGGGGIDAGGNVEIRNCKIYGNSGVGVDEWGAGGILIGGGNPKILNCEIFDNYSPHGAAAFRGGDIDLLMKNTLIVSNRGTAALHIHSSSGEIVNCTIANNDGKSAGGNPSPIVFKNCILWNNPSGDWAGFGDFTYSDVEQGVVGPGNITLNPVFVNQGARDYHLQTGSPCIDAGDPDPGDNDIDGSRNDMGAFGGPGGESYPYQDGPPVVENVVADPAILAPASDVVITAFAWDAQTTVKSVQAEIESPDENVVAAIALFDDGAHNDGAAGDSTFGNSWTTPSGEASYYIDIIAEDNQLHSATYGNIGAFTTQSSLIEISNIIVDDDQVGQSFGNGDGILNPGEFVELRYDLANTGSVTLETVYGVPDSSFDVYFHPDTIYWMDDHLGGWFNIAPGETVQGDDLDSFIAANTPDGHVITVPVAFYDVNDTPVGNDTLRIPVTGTDATPPRIDWASADPSYTPVGNIVKLTALISEAGDLASVAADIENPDENVIASIILVDDATNGDGVAGDHIFTGQWSPASEANFLVDVRASDAFGNDGGGDNLAGFTSIPPPAATANLLLVDDDNNNNPNWGLPKPYNEYYQEALDALGLAYDVWNGYYYGGPPADSLNNYLDGAAIWETGDDYFSTLTPDDQTALTGYLNAGGRLFISGQVIGYDLDWDGSDADRAFYNDYLHATMVSWAGLLELDGVSGDPISDAMNLQISGGSGADNQANVIEIDPMNGATPIFTYRQPPANAVLDSTELVLSLREQLEMAMQRQNVTPAALANLAKLIKTRASHGDTESLVSSGTGGLRVDTGAYKLVYLAFGFEAIADEINRMTLMDRILAWLQSTGCISDGDVNHDGNLTPGDALCAFKVFLNGQVVSADCDIPDWDCEVIAGDVNCDGTTTPGDALAIFQRFLHGNPPLECFAQAGLNLTKRNPRAEPYRLSLVQRTVLQSAEANGRDLIELSLRVDHPEGLTAFGLGLSYPAEKLDFVGIRRTALTQEWIELDGQLAEPGELLIGGFNIDAVETVAAGDLFELTFVSKGQSIRADEFGVTELTDDLSDALLSAQASGLAGVATVPTAFKLYQSYPNPFQGHSAQDAVIRFDLAGSEAMQVELSIYNITGQLVRRLVTGSRTPGQYEISWDGRNASGLQLPSGTYFYRLKAGDFVDSRYLSVVR